MMGRHAARRWFGGAVVIAKRRKLRGVLLCLCLGTGISIAGGALYSLTAKALDYHALFEARCGACHGHAGDLARAKLIFVDGALIGRETGNDIRIFLSAHYGGLSIDESAALYDMLFRQVAAAGFFRERCGICHVRARDLTKANLIVVGSELHGRYSGRDMAAFLPGHGRLDAEEAAFIHAVLLRITQGRR